MMNSYIDYNDYNSLSPAQTQKNNNVIDEFGDSWNEESVSNSSEQVSPYIIKRTRDDE